MSKKELITALDQLLEHVDDQTAAYDLILMAMADIELKRACRVAGQCPPAGLDESHTR